jgi:hypothetical protein
MQGTGSGRHVLVNATTIRLWLGSDSLRWASASFCTRLEAETNAGRPDPAAAYTMITLFGFDFDIVRR